MIDVQVPSGKDRGKWALDFQLCNELSAGAITAFLDYEEAYRTYSHSNGPTKAAINLATYRLFSVGSYMENDTKLQFATGVAMDLRVAEEITEEDNLSNK